MKHTLNINTIEAMVLMNALRTYNPQKSIEIELSERLKAKISDTVTKDLTEEEQKE